MKEYTQHTAQELTFEQLVDIAQKHLHAPVFWGEESQDCVELREKIARQWMEDIHQGDKPQFLNAWIHTENQSIGAFLWAQRKERPTPHAMIHSLWVDGALQRRGFARSLKNAVEEWTRDLGMHCVQTKIHANNPKIRALNASMGYEDTFILQRKILPPVNSAETT